MRTRLPIPDLIAIILGDLTGTPDRAGINDLLRWAWGDAYWQTNATPTPRRAPDVRQPGVGILTIELNGGPLPNPPGVRYPAGADPQPRQDPAPTTDGTGDTVPGARHDPGLAGNYRARSAYQRATQLLYLTDGRLRTAAAIAAHGHGKFPARQLTGRGHHDLTLALKAVTVDQHLLAIITRDLARLPHSPKALAAIKAELEAAAEHTGDAWHRLTNTLADGTATQDRHGAAVAIAPNERCKHWKNGCPNPKGEKAGGRCYRCQGYFKRHGHEIPETLLRKPIADAQAAQRRRQARGEGWGQA